MDKPSLGLIAGNGKFPLLFAQKAKVNGYQVVAAAVKGDTSYSLKALVDQFQWFSVGELKKLFDYFKKNGVKDVIMAGQVSPRNLFDEKLTLDQEFQDLFKAMKDRKADTIFSAVAKKLDDYGMKLIDSTFLIKEYLAPKGTLTKRAPSLQELGDIEFGCHVAKAMGAIDVGQTVVIKDKAIVAIEAMEGTDQTILRGGRIASGGAVIVKMSKPNQDFRFDVPVVGPRTIEFMKKVKAKCLAIEAQKTIVIDYQKTVYSANKNDICIVAA